MQRSGRKKRLAHSCVSALLIVALVVTLCTVRPQPAHAGSTDVNTVAIILGAVIGGLIVIAVILTLLVRNNPAWMPALPEGALSPRADAWERPGDRVRFAWNCRGPDGGMALVCW